MCIRDRYGKEKNAENILVDCDYFTTSLYDMDKSVSKDLSGLDSFLIVICIAGEGKLEDAEGHTETLRQGETVLIPADCKGVTFTPSDSKLQILTSYVK